MQDFKQRLTLEGDYQAIFDVLRVLRETDRAAEAKVRIMDRRYMNSLAFGLVGVACVVMSGILASSGPFGSFEMGLLLVGLLIMLISFFVAVAWSSQRSSAESLDLDNSRYEGLENLHRHLESLNGPETKYSYRLNLLDYCDPRFKQSSEQIGNMFSSIRGENAVFLTDVLSGTATLSENSKISLVLNRNTRRKTWSEPGHGDNPRRHFRETEYETHYELYREEPKYLARDSYTSESVDLSVEPMIRLIDRFLDEEGIQVPSESGV